MSEAAQILLYIIILVLTILLIVLGIQVFFILRDIRKTVTKTNKVLDNTEEITDSIKRPLSSLSALIMGIRAGSSLMKIINKGEEKDKEDK